jgi:hypothetical protein
LLAALFFVFRGIQESTANGQTPPATSNGKQVPAGYQQLLLQRARQLNDAHQDQLRAGSSHDDAFELAFEELEITWKMLDLLEAGQSLNSRLQAEPIQPAYTQQVNESADVEQMLNEPFAEAQAAPVEAKPLEPMKHVPVKELIVDEPRVADSSAAERGTVDANPLRFEAKPEKRQLTRSEQILSNKIKYCLHVYRNPMEMSSRDKTCWELMHTMIGYGVDNHVWVGRNRFNTIGYLCWNGKCKGFELFENEKGQLQAKQGYGVQGHHGQFLAMLAQHRVDPGYVIKAGGKDFTIHDLIEFEKQTCVPKSELTFKLIALSHYLDSDATWTNEHGQWSIPRLINEELEQPVVGSACGGTHRLMGLSYAVRYREKREEPMTGQWQRAKQFTESYQDYAFNLQNRNGSFSTKWFEGRADNSETQRYQETSGHITEWLAYSLPEERLHDRRMVAAVNFLANLLLENHDYEWKIGPRGHAIRALALYHERAFGENVTVRVAKATRSN